MPEVVTSTPCPCCKPYCSFCAGASNELYARTPQYYDVALVNVAVPDVCCATQNGGPPYDLTYQKGIPQIVNTACRLYHQNPNDASPLNSVCTWRGEVACSRMVEASQDGIGSCPDGPWANPTITYGPVLEFVLGVSFSFPGFWFLEVYHKLNYEIPSPPPPPQGWWMSYHFTLFRKYFPYTDWPNDTRCMTPSLTIDNVLTGGCAGTFASPSVQIYGDGGQAIIVPGPAIP